MNRRLFFEAIQNDVSGLARALGLSVRDTLACIYDEGFFGKDLKIIQKGYKLTDSQIREIFSEDEE